MMKLLRMTKGLWCTAGDLLLPQAGKRWNVEDEEKARSKGLGLETHSYILSLVDNNLSMRGREKSTKRTMILINASSSGHGAAPSINTELRGGHFKGPHGVSWGYPIRK